MEPCSAARRRVLNSARVRVTVSRDVPMIVLSTKEEPTVKVQAFAVGANDYLVKLPDRLASGGLRYPVGLCTE